MFSPRSSLAAVLWTFALGACLSARPVTAEESSLASPQTPAEIEALLDGASVTDREKLQKQRARFEKLSRQQQDDLRKLYSQLQMEEDGGRLRQVMDSYYEWLATLTASEQAELAGLSPAARLDKIRTLQISQRNGRIQEVSQGSISPEDAKEIVRWLDEYFSSNQERILAKMSEPMRAKFDESKNEHRKRMMLVGFAHQEGMMPDASALAELRGLLSPPARQRLEAAGDVADQLAVVRRWLGAYAWQSWRNRVSPAELEKFWERLPQEEQRRLEQLPPEEMQRVLGRMMFERGRRDRPRPGHPR